jgi:hypothetical protein
LCYWRTRPFSADTAIAGIARCLPAGRRFFGVYAFRRQVPLWRWTLDRSSMPGRLQRVLALPFFANQSFTLVSSIFKSGSERLSSRQLRSSDWRQTCGSSQSPEASTLAWERSRTLPARGHYNQSWDSLPTRIYRACSSCLILNSRYSERDRRRSPFSVYSIRGFTTFSAGNLPKSLSNDHSCLTPC